MQQPVTYRISCTGERPRFDSVPVAKITDYPLEKRDYKPFAQSILCLGGGALHLRMWAFEVSPAPTSALRCVLYPFAGDPGRALHIVFCHGEGDLVEVSARLVENGQALAGGEKLAGSLIRRPHNGEDLQGVYWGMSVELPLAALEDTGGKTRLLPGESIPGNFYKTCEDRQFAHSGSLAPARFAQGVPFGLDSMGNFVVTAY